MRKKLNRITAIFIALGICFVVCDIPRISAENTVTVGDFQITGNANAYSYSAKTLIITGSDSLIIKNTNSVSSTDNHIIINGSANITLAGINIDVSAIANTAAIDIVNANADVTINLATQTTNSLQSGENCAGIQKKGGGTGQLIIDGNDTSVLNVTGGKNASGIGGGYFSSGSIAEKTISNIVINGGHIVAYAGAGGSGAGIGGAEASDIIINGGFIDANATGNGAGIGGASGNGHDILISGGTVYAWAGDYTGYDMGSGAGIGGGGTGNGYNISITGGKVKACGGGIGGAGIGSGGFSGLSAYNIEISGGNVQALAYTNAPGIGSGSSASGSCHDITISGGSVIAKCQYVASGAANGIGTVDGTNVSNIFIQGGNVEAKGFGGLADLGTLPTDILGSRVYKVSLTIEGITESKTVSSITTELNGVSKTEQINADTLADTSGGQMCSLYMPENAIIQSITIDNEPYINLSSIPIQVKNDGSTVGSLRSQSLVSGDFIVKNGIYGTDYTFDPLNRVLHIMTNTTLEISSLNVTTDRIVVDAGVAANIILSGITIDVSQMPNRAAFEIVNTPLIDVTLHLKEGSTNQLTSGDNCAALEKNGDTSLIIDGNGVLMAYGGNNGAGIGGSQGTASDHITIVSGTILAVGGGDAAGIGNGANTTKPSSNIQILGGSINAYSKGSGSAISGTPINSAGESLYQVSFCIPKADENDTFYIDNINQKGITYFSSILHPLKNNSETPINGWIYLWLPKQEQINLEITSSVGNSYTYIGTIENDNNNRLKMEQTDFILTFADTTSPVYGDTFNLKTTQGVSDEAVIYSTNSSNIQVESNTGIGSFIATGDYIIQAIKPGNAYYWDAYSELKGTVAPRPIQLQWYGTESRVYDGTASKISASILNIVGDDEVSVVVKGGNAKEIGLHQAVISGLIGNDKAFYTFTDSDLSVVYEITEVQQNNPEQDSPKESDPEKNDSNQQLQPEESNKTDRDDVKTGDNTFSNYSVLMAGAVVIMLLLKRKRTDN